MLITKTRIIATVGPAILNGITSWEDYEDKANEEKVEKAVETIKNMIKKGATTFRLNMSHGTHELHKFSIELIRSVAEDLKTNVDFIVDTKGPEIRVNEVQPNTQIKKSQLITIYTQKKVIGNAHSFSVYDEQKKYNMIDDLQEGYRILVDDGKLILKILKINRETNEIIAEAINSHTLKTNKRINLPDSNYSIPFLSERDFKDILFAIENKVLTIALSFLSNPNQVIDIRRLINRKYIDFPLPPKLEFIAKIETREAIQNIDAILEEVQGVMIARGDLGLEISYYEVPYYQKEIIAKANAKNKIAIVATQMLDSLETSIIPTRAEVNDVYTAVIQNATGVMLSGETAAGHDPVNAVEKMGRIVLEAEKRKVLSLTNEQVNEFIDDELVVLPEMITQKEMFRNFIKVLRSDKTSKEKNKLFVFNLKKENQMDMMLMNSISWPAAFLFIVPEDEKLTYIPLNSNENYLYHDKPILNLELLKKYINIEEYEVWFV